MDKFIGMGQGPFNLYEAPQSTTRITILCRDADGTLAKLLEAIKKAGNVGHSFSIVVDPGDEREEKFFWDGDGADSIQDISVNKI